jgi:monovalent cation/hydrogen antiporter
MYYAAEHFHFSGVLAVVSGGLLLSSQRNVLLSPTARVQGANVWTTIGFVLNGIVFLLIGLQLPSIIEELEEVSLQQAIWYGLLISFVLIVTRICCTLGASVFTRFVSRFIKVADVKPGWRMPFVFGWAGMRGVVSLAAALSIPVALSAGQPFPYRNLILVITFIVILVTLVFQGLTLPWVMRKLKINEEFDAGLQGQELAIRKAMTQASMRVLEKADPDASKNDHVQIYSEKLKHELKVFGNDLEEFNSTGKKDLMEYYDVYLGVLNEQRKVLNQLIREDGYDEEIIRKYLTLVDLEEMKLMDMKYE